ncbi:Wzz/FepE/Etk N-terminal domain-containing protein [Radiobacillus kanasensis]|uniref:Wzz/FepE/Etk N-terminal domain-containing protein n=1 Tax=Radiobacillus kanasensis TaxID=2844358 RepID=UPI001E39DD62|nr:Wzz/FepE/Etk N-terminal domain-containing protein [Radiobacillus kanasensis]UFT98876.1 Wzz/FepE/Etk N-terminal domain-containing protein [Radiobacillus kanasensis]
MEERNQVKNFLFTLWKGKLLIVLITLFFLALGFVFNKFILNDTYRATTKIELGSYEELVQDLDPQITRLFSSNGIIEVMNSDEVLESVINEMNLNSSLDELKAMISFQVSSADNGILINKTGSNEQLNKEVIQSIVSNTDKELSLLLKEQTDDRASYYNEKMDEEISKVRQAISDLKKVNVKLPSVLVVENLFGPNKIIDINEEITDTIDGLTPEEMVNVVQTSSEIQNSVKNYNDYLAQYEEISSISKDNENIFNELSIEQLDSDTESVKTGPNESFNYFAALMLGLLLSIFLVLFLDYYKKIIRD